MKISKYNMIWDLEDGKTMAFNSMSCALAEIDDDFMVWWRTSFCKKN